MRAESRWLLAVVVLMVACGGGEGGGTDLVGDQEDDQQEQPDLLGDGLEQDVPDVSADGNLGDLPADLVTDSAPTDVEDVEVLPTPLPVEPQPIAAELVLKDAPFEQEFNHTWNENEPEVGELVALVMPPQTGGYELWDVPTLVSPQGVLLRDVAGTLVPAALGDGNPDPLKAAAATADAVYVATAQEVYRITPQGEFFLVGSLPAESTLVRLAVARGQVHVLGSGFWAIVEGDQLEPVTGHEAPTTLVEVNDGYLVAWEGWLAKLAGDSVASSLEEVWRVPHDAGSVVAVLRQRTLPQNLDLVVVGSTGVAAFELQGAAAPKPLTVPLFGEGRLPLTGAVAAAETADGGFVVGAAGGAYRPRNREGEVEYRVYAADRWMPAGEMRDVAVSDDDGTVYFATSGGLGWVTTTTWSVLEKMAPMVERIVLRHDRDGAVADSRLTVPGDLSTNIPWDSDNDGGWSCYWVVGECMRYLVTGDQEAKAHFDKSLDRMLSLRTLTGTDYFLARAVIRIDGCLLDDCDNPDDGEWFKSPDGEWWVKANTSNDEVTSHMFMMGFAHDLCADEAQKQAIVEHIDGIVGGLVDNGYRLVDPQDGQPTSYGQFDPQYINWWVEGKWADGARRSAQMLAALNLAHYLTGKQKYLDAKAYLMGEHHYDDNIDNVGDATLYPYCAGNGDCDELGTQAFYALIRYEPDPVLRARWVKAWGKLYESLKTQQDALWDLSNLYLGGLPSSLEYVMRWFRNYPTDLIRFIMHNQARKDTVPAPAYYLTKDKNAGFVMRSDGRILPGDERPNDRHNTNQFVANGGWGPNVEMDSADVLFAYWMGRYYGFIKE